MLVDVTIDMLDKEMANLLCSIACVGGYGPSIAKRVDVNAIGLRNEVEKISPTREFFLCDFVRRNNRCLSLLSNWRWIRIETICEHTYLI